MEIEETKVTVYPFNITGNSFLSNRDSLYSQTEYLEDYSIRIVTCDIKEKWINVITAQEPYESWDEMNLDSLKKNDTIDLTITACENKTKAIIPDCVVWKAWVKIILIFEGLD